LSEDQDLKNLIAVSFLRNLDQKEATSLKPFLSNGLKNELTKLEYSREIQTPVNRKILQMFSWLSLFMLSSCFIGILDGFYDFWRSKDFAATAFRDFWPALVPWGFLLKMSLSLTILLGVPLAISIYSSHREFQRFLNDSDITQRGEIKFSRGTVWCHMFLYTFLVGVGVSWAVYGNGGWGALAFAPFAICAGSTIPSLMSIRFVSWDQDGLQGPSKTFGSILRAARTKIAWADIVESDRLLRGYWYVEASDGRRIYWDSYFSGYDRLTLALRHQCPSLPLPPSME
jgi:hypothetical protein